IQETVHVTFDELTKGLTPTHNSVGLAPNSHTSIQNSAKLEISALQLGRTRSELVNEPSPPSVPPIKAQLSELFYPLFADDDEVAPTSNVHPNLDDIDDGNIFDPYVANEEASSSNTADVNVTYNSPPPHVQTWTKDHPLENMIGELNRPVST
nr:hypothetical protein [Tanacetum cinerariifolium]